MKLLASMSFRQASTLAKRMYSNGCGPSWFPRFLTGSLNKIFGKDVCEACSIHDWDYAHKYNRKKSDVRFLKNLKLLATESAKDRRMLYSRLAVAYIYYFAVRVGGMFSYD